MDQTFEKRNWATEIHSNDGSAFSFEIKQQLHSEKTPYQTIEIYETTHYGNLMTIDGFNMLTTRDNFLYHEMMAHCSLFTHPRPENIVIIGGGDCGTLQQVLQHEYVKHVLQVEIDERVTRLSEKYFPELCTSNTDPRAEFAFIDGINWMANADSESVDIIIIDSTDPVGPGEVLVTAEFYQHCQRVLKQDGLVIQQSESPFLHLDIIKKMHNNLMSAGFASTQLINFPQPCYPTGWWSATMAGKAIDLTQFRQQAVENKSFKTQYYNASIHQGAMAQSQFVLEYLS